MRVTKKDGKFVVDDEPMRLTGKAAQQFRADLEQADRGSVHKNFLAECQREYAARQAKPAQ